MATSIKINDHLKQRIQSLAETKDRSSHWVMCEAIQEYVEREEARESFKKEALQSWQAFQETGQHLTGAETSDWLDQWGTEIESEQPTCHD